MEVNTENDVIIGSWNELTDKVYDDSWKSDLGRFRSDFVFRGLPDKKHNLKSSFFRNCGDNPNLEYHILRNFRKYGQFDHPERVAGDWKIMTVAQHHGLPTRLLDWTYSPFVAMHFATDNLSEYDKDGVIWQVDFVKANKLLPQPLKKELANAGANAFTIEMIEKAVPTIKEFEKLSDHNLVIFFEPTSMDARIVNQFALFSVMSKATIEMDVWLAEHPEIYRRIIIPKELKWEVRDKLDQANITERMLFPGLDGLTKWLTRHYKPVK